MNGFDDLQRLVDEVTGEAQDEPGRFRSFLAALQAVFACPPTRMSSASPWSSSPWITAGTRGRG